MADYYPLIARAVAGLEKSTGGARRALYERARAALVEQLRNATPALGESDITRERLALEEAVRKVEAEAARRMRYETPRSESTRSETSRSETSRSETSRSEATRAEAGRPQSPAPEAARANSASPSRAAESARRSEIDRRSDGVAPRRERNADPAPPRASVRTPLDLDGDIPRVPPRERAARERPSVSDAGLRGFRDVVAEAERLGDAAASAARSARRALGGGASDGGKPDARNDFDTVRAGGARPVMLEPEFSFDDSRPPIPRAQPALDLPADEAPSQDIAPPGCFKRYIAPTAGLVVLVAVATIVYWQRDVLATAYGGVEAMFRSQPTPPAGRDVGPVRAKIPDRVPAGGSAAPTAATLPSRPGAAPEGGGAIAPVAQRVVLYEEDASDNSGKRFVGTAVWRTERVSRTQGQPQELAVRADVEIPERRLTISWSLRRNTDQSLPASHTIEILFTMPADFPHGGISNVPGMLMKQSEQTRGTPLSGLAVKVTSGFFLIGLSAVESDLQRNMQLLRERAWFDIPIVYADGKRAILAVEKGTPGERAFNEAFSSWARR
ncbi:MAG: hypothetical protein HY056_09010 [Proteobacteria bacterium]|nr:hypothetical protein [Pseudomonadota bacterium]